MGRNKIVYEETYIKGTYADKDDVLKIVNNENCKIEALKAGRFEDGKEFLTIKLIL